MSRSNAVAGSSRRREQCRRCYGSPQRGFTLVELVVVIVVLGILSVGTVQFISDSSNGLASTIDRTELAAEGRLILERLGRTVRTALPNSMRVNADGSCLEFIPVAAAAFYIDVPIGTATNSFQSAPLPMPIDAGLRTAVYPDSTAYTLGTNAVVSPAATASDPDGDNEVTVTFASAHSFKQLSPHQRYFWVTEPVSFCVVDGRLWRYQDYGFNATQPVVADLPATPPGRSLLADAVTSGVGVFATNGASRNRNAVLSIKLELERNDDVLMLDHVAQVRNVP